MLPAPGYASGPNAGLGPQSPSLALPMEAPQPSYSEAESVYASSQRTPIVNVVTLPQTNSPASIVRPKPGVIIKPIETLRPVAVPTPQPTTTSSKSLVQPAEMMPVVVETTSQSYESTTQEGIIAYNDYNAEQTDQGEQAEVTQDEVVEVQTAGTTTPEATTTPSSTISTTVSSPSEQGEEYEDYGVVESERGTGEAAASRPASGLDFNQVTADMQNSITTAQSGNFEEATTPYAAQDTTSTASDHTTTTEATTTTTPQPTTTATEDVITITVQQVDPLPTEAPVEAIASNSADPDGHDYESITEDEGTHPELQVLPEVAPSFSMPPTDPPTATDESVMGVTDMQSNSFDYGHDYPETGVMGSEVQVDDVKEISVATDSPYKFASQAAGLPQESRDAALAFINEIQHNYRSKRL